MHANSYLMLKLQHTQCVCVCVKNILNCLYFSMVLTSWEVLIGVACIFQDSP